MKQASKLLVLLTVICALVFVANTVMAAELAKDQTLKLALPVRDIKNLDTAFATLTGEKEIVGEITNGLLRFPYGKIDLNALEGDLAESWETSDDGLVWTIKLRKGVKWHKGYGEMTAEDVKFTYERIMDEATGSPWRSRFKGIEKIEIVDPYTVKFVLKKVDPFFEMKMLGYHGGQIISKKAVEELGDKFTTSPVGTGPFVFESYESGQKVVLSANQDYFRGAPVIQHFEFLFMPDDSSRLLAIKKGEVDLGRGIVDQVWIRQAKKQKLIPVPPNPAQQLIVSFNMKMKPLDDLKVRQALAYAINTNDVIALFGDVLSGPMVSPVPPGYFGHIDEGLASYPYNVEKAKALLAEAGYKDGLDLGRVFCSESFEYLKPMQILQEHFRQVGVNFEIQVVDHSTYHKRIREDLNPLVIYGGVRVPVADSILTQFYHSASIVQTPTAKTNFSHYGEVIPGIDELVDEARGIMDHDRQAELYAQAQKKIMEDLPSYPICLIKQAFVRQPWVDLGYDTDPYETLYYIIEVSEKTRILKH